MLPLDKIPRDLYLFVQQRFFLFLFFLLLLGMGIIYGTGLFRPLPFTERLLLVENQSRLFYQPAAEGGTISFFWDIFFTQQFSLWIFFLLGLSIVGVLFIPLLIFLRGFVLGFTVAFLLTELSSLGFLFTLFLVLPHNLIVLPTILFAAVSGVVFSWGLVEKVLDRGSFFPFPGLLDYMFLFLLLALFLLLGSLVEACIVPILLRILLFFFC